MILDYADVVHRLVPIEHPVKTAFGTMTERHAVFIVLGDAEGRRGVGESWVNFPLWAPWERVAAFEKVIFPWLVGRRVEGIPEFIRTMFDAFAGPSLQSGTMGPLLQAFCAVELALWDLEARRRSAPLCGLWFEKPATEVEVYASGINSPLPWPLIDAMLDRGVRLFKLKLGFGADEDRRNLQALTTHLGDRARIAVDVNRHWTFDEAIEWLPILADHDVQWIEEPLAADQAHRLDQLHAQSPLPLAGGENMLFPPNASADPIARMPWDIFQPDVTKYCPLHMALALRHALADGTSTLVPHILGSAPGHAASLHLAAGCRGLVEWDINVNPLRTDMLSPAFDISGGRIRIPDRPGLGWDWTEHA